MTEIDYLKLKLEDTEKVFNSTLRKLDERITRLERIEQKREKDKINWALNQFRDREKTEEEQEAFLILKKALNPFLRCE